MKNLPLLIVTIVGTLALVVGIAVMFSGGNAGTAKTVDQAQLVGEARYVKGPAEAKVTIVEFSDFQCPACRAIYPNVKQLMAQYPTDVRVVYRHFPLNSIHPYAQISAQASVVAGEFNKFWEMHDLLFERQDQWSTLSSQDEVKNTLVTYAEELGIDKAQFSERIDSDSARSIVNQDLSYATQLGIDSTPTFFVNGQETAPNQLLPAVQSLLNSN